MTLTSSPRTTARARSYGVAAPRRPRINRSRQMWLLLSLVGLAWSVARAGYDLPSLVNGDGWGQVADFFSSMVTPDLSGDLLRVVVDEALVTVSYALVGTALALVIGLIGGVLVAERLWGPGSGRWGWRVCRTLLVLPRSMHEVVFGLVLVSVLGLDPLVAVLAIGIPFGAMTAKVFAELLDEAPRDAEQALRAAGAGRITALMFGTFPHAMGDLLSYTFYRFECAIRSAAVLGIVGAGGLGVQLRLSFESVRYDQVWTMLWALILISGAADQWSSAVRRRRRSPNVHTRTADPPEGPPRRDRFLQVSVGALLVGVPAAWWWVGVDASSLWSDRARRLGSELASDAWPPRFGPGGAGALLSDAADTVALAILALALAGTFAACVAFLARRPPLSPHRPATWIMAGASALSRFVLLVARTVPPPVWAFLTLFVFLPGLWPGAIALGIYNLGVLGRLEAEVVENLDHRPGEALQAGGAGHLGTLAYATLPAVSGRFVALSLYRWEVAARDTVMVGVVGAAGLGRRLHEQTAAFDYNGILATILALVVVTVAVDLTSAALRRSLR